MFTIATVSVIATNLNKDELEANMYNEHSPDFIFLADDDEWIDLTVEAKKERSESTKQDLDNYMTINKKCDNDEIKVTTLRTTSKNKYKKLEVKCVPQSRR